jgi:hypothetical protein
MRAGARPVMASRSARAVELSPEEAEAVVRRAEALKRLVSGDEIRAKYKLELIFGEARSTWKPTPGILSFWEAGARFHGGGDQKIYLCPGRRLGRSGCEAPIPELGVSLGTLVCPACGTTWAGEDVIGELCFNLPMRKWAAVLNEHVRKFDYDADLYLKHAPSDIRSIALAQAKKQTFRGSERLDLVRSRRARHVYPLRNIVKDTSAGADLLSRIYAFLVS